MIATLIGGHGFLGTNLALALVARGIETRILDAVPPRAPVGATWIAGNVADTACLDEAIRGADLVYHLAWSTLPATSNLDPAGDVRTNVLQSLAIVDACVAHGVRKLVFLSSGGTVYGVPRTTPIPEEHPTDPICSYGITKLAVEKYLALAQRIQGLDYAAVRLANPYGEHQRPGGAQGAVAAFLGHVARREPITVWGDGSVVRDYLYVGDAIAALVLVGTRTAPTDAPRVVNVGSGIGVSLRELIEAIRRVVDVPLVVVHAPPRIVDVPANVLDIGRIRGIVGWSPTVGLDEGLSRTWRWIRSLPA